MSVVRMNVSIPRDLKQRMDEVQGRVNWSAIAARAFAEFLDRTQEERLSWVGLQEEMRNTIWRR